MKACPACGRALPEINLYCTHCGAGVSAETERTATPPTSRPLAKEQLNLNILYGMVTVLIVSVVQKSREIGILRAVGTPARRILLVFLIQGGVLGVVGAIAGSGLGALFAKLFEGLVRDPSGAPRFPVQLDASLFALSIALATGVGLLSAVIPARRAARLDPATAIRNG